MIIDLKSLNQDLTRCGESCYQLKCSSSLKFFTRKIPPSSEVKLTEFEPLKLKARNLDSKLVQCFLALVTSY